MVNIKGKNPPQFGYVVENGTDNHTVSAEELEKLWKKKKYQRFHIQLVDENGEEGEIVCAEAHRMRMLPIRDRRHLKDCGLGHHEDIPQGVSPDEHVMDNHSLPNGVSWQYLEGNDWINYPYGLSCRIERLYHANSPHYLYTPENPHCSGACKWELSLLFFCLLRCTKQTDAREPFTIIYRCCSGCSR